MHRNNVTGRGYFYREINVDERRWLYHGNATDAEDEMTDRRN